MLRSQGGRHLRRALPSVSPVACSPLHAHSSTRGAPGAAQGGRNHSAQQHHSQQQLRWLSGQRGDGSSRFTLPPDATERIARLRKLVTSQAQGGGSISVDTRDLFRSEDDVRFVPHPDKPPPTPLALDLAARIKLRGPITMADFMYQALQHPQHGYYTRESDKFGTAGDFTTAPEMSQLFGELLGVWCVATWRAGGAAAAPLLVEGGPGRGTLMADLLRAVRVFPDFVRALAAGGSGGGGGGGSGGGGGGGVHLVETSPALRRAQAAALGAAHVTMPNASGVQTGAITLATAGDSGGPVTIPVTWHRELRSVPAGYTLLIAQELLDALPVHQFEAVPVGSGAKAGGGGSSAKRVAWRERLVDVDEGPGGHHLRHVLSTAATPAVRALLEAPDAAAARADAVAAAATAALQAAGRKKKGGGGGGAVAAAVAGGAVDAGAVLAADVLAGAGAAAGDRIEVSPMALAVVQETAARIAAHGGGALLIDYGEDHPQGDTLRAFKAHKEVHVLEEPGMADITADVDFAALRRCVAAVPGARAHGPVGQGAFLAAMGAAERAAALLEAPGVTDAQAEAIFTSFERLVDPQQMGTKYKVLAIVNSSHPETPPGFPPPADAAAAGSGAAEPSPAAKRGATRTRIR